MSHEPFYQDNDIPPFEEIAGLTISPQTDIPFGKHFTMGLAIYTVYETTIEQGFTAGIEAHKSWLHDQRYQTPTMLDDGMFTMVLDQFTPRDLEGYNKSVWRAHFIAGWASVYLGHVPEAVNQ